MSFEKETKIPKKRLRGKEMETSCPLCINKRQMEIKKNRTKDRAMQRTISLYVKVTFYKLKGSKVTCLNDFKNS